jgi:drug/metabolite transporter superfamily protein YnfA
MHIVSSVFPFVAAALFEIAGCFAFWMWLRRGASPLMALLGAAYCHVNKEENS